jgi:3-hydroxyisobutyrate dehydrogenase-like beta-hydroxyacid dehydrogenase
MAKSPRIKPRLGYLGLGLMGLPMTRHLVSKGYQIKGFDIIAKRCREAETAGVSIVKKAADVAKDTDIILLNLPTTQSVEDAIFGKGAVAAQMNRGQIILDFSTG